MQNTHEPHDAFVDRLADTIGAEVRQRNRSRLANGWRQRLLQSPMKLAAAAAVLVIVSMIAGGMVVVAAYQAQTNEARATLLAGYEQRSTMAKTKLAGVQALVGDVEQRVRLGLEPGEAVLDAKFRVAEATAQVQLIDAQIAEIRASGTEPLSSVSSPIIAGRDFVTERWGIEMSVTAAALELERAHLSGTTTRFQLGAANGLDVDASRTRLSELQAAMDTFQNRFAIRQRFLKHEIDAGLANLRILEIEAEQRRASLRLRVDLTRKTVASMGALVTAGGATSVEVAEANVRLLELQLELSKVDADLAAIQRQIGQRK